MESSSSRNSETINIPAEVYGKRVARLQSVIKQCGMCVPSSVYERVKRAPESERETLLMGELEEIIGKEGLSTDTSEKYRQKKSYYRNGVFIEEMSISKHRGKIAAASKKQMVYVNYISMLEDGLIVDSCWNYPFRLGAKYQQVISGLDIGVNGMRVGDRRMLTIPPHRGYGSIRCKHIPPNSTLYYYVELLSV